MRADPAPILTRVVSVVSKGKKEQGWITHWCGRFVVLEMACADANPERNENTGEADQAKSNATRFQALFPQSPQQAVDGEKLMRCTSVSFKLENNGGGDTRV
jgi:hypothetical protein